MIVTALLVGLSIGFALYTYFRRKYFTLHADYGRVVPGLPPEFLLGNVRQSGMLSGVPLYKILDDSRKELGDVFQFFLGPSHVTVFGHPDHAQHILSHRNIYDASDLVKDQFEILFPRALVCLRGAAHRRHARVLLPMLRKSKALGFADVIARHVNSQVGYWKAVTAGNDQKVYPHVSRDIAMLTMDLVGLIAFDQDFNLLQNIKDQNDAVYDVVKLAREHSKTEEMPLRIAIGYLLHRFPELQSSGLPLTFVKLLAQYEPLFTRSKKTIRDHVLKCIENRRKTEEADEDDKKLNVLNKLVSAIPADDSQIPDDDSSNLTKEEALDELTVVLFGGYETTWTTLSWLVHYLSKYPEVQQKIKQEIKQLLPDPSSELTGEVLNKLEYLDCVVKETLRLAPISHASARVAMIDDVIDGVHIKKGQQLFMSSYSFQIDPRFWKVDPLKFSPERFYGPDAPDAKHHPYAFIPFGGGHHACAGQDLARVEIKGILAAWMRLLTFHDSPGNDGTIVGRLSCRPKAISVRLSFDS